MKFKVGDVIIKNSDKHWSTYWNSSIPIGSKGIIIKINKRKMSVNWNNDLIISTDLNELSDFKHMKEHIFDEWLKNELSDKLPQKDEEYLDYIKDDL